MKLSLNTAQYYSNVPLGESAEALEAMIGAQLGAVEAVEQWAPRYAGVLVARVVSCLGHEAADRLNVCLINDGGVAAGVERDENGLVQVVCGAPNVREGMTVAWIPPGVTVPVTHDTAEPFVLAAKELRGIVSNGMLASPRELGISDEHEGILEIIEAEVGAELLVPGTPFARLYGLDDTVFDIENKMFTHRPDCFGVIGLARELAGIQGLAYRSPEWYITPLQHQLQTDLPLAISVESPNVVPRFVAAAIDGVSVRPSPVWVQAALKRAGIRPLNNLVDATNFLMYVTGQPLHAYDYAKVKALSGDVPTLQARLARGGEQVALLNGKTIQLAAGQDIVIATDKAVVALGGVMGGADTEVDATTTSIILEAATFDMYAVRSSSMRHGVVSDAVTRFNKGQSPLQNLAVIAYAVKTVQDVAGGLVASAIHDIDHADHQPVVVTVTADFINQRLGLELTAETMAAILGNVEFEVVVNGDELAVTVPFWRTDIAIAEDVVEEVGRLYGYDKLPLVLPQRSLAPAVRNVGFDRADHIRQVLAAGGANEVFSYSFVPGRLLRASGQNPAAAFEISNALRPDLQYYRLSLLPSLLAKVHMNQKAGYGRFALFELGKAHAVAEVDVDGLPAASERLALVYAAKRPEAGAAYFRAAYYVRYAARALGIDGRALSFRPIDETAGAIAAPLAPGRAAAILHGETVIGYAGEIAPATTQALKLPAYCAGFELLLDAVAVADTTSYHPLPTYPLVSQDLTLRLPAAVVYDQLAAALTAALQELTGPTVAMSISPIDDYRQAEGGQRSITTRVRCVSRERTLRDSEVAAWLDEAAARLHDTLGTERG